MAHQGGGAIGILVNLHQIGIVKILATVAQQQKIAMAGNGREQIVEIMRHTARQLANGLHFLTLGKLCLKRLQRRGILQHRQNATLSVFGETAQGHLQEHLALKPARAQHL